MKDYKHVAFLCGYFNLPEQYGQTPFLTEGWKEIVYDDGMIEVWGIERSGFFNDRGKWAKGFDNQRV